MSQTVPADTDPEMYQLQIDRWRSMSPVERARLAERLSADVTTIAIAGILRDRRRRPLRLTHAHRRR